MQLEKLEPNPKLDGVIIMIVTSSANILHSFELTLTKACKD